MALSAFRLIAPFRGRGRVQGLALALALLVVADAVAMSSPEPKLSGQVFVDANGNAQAVFNRKVRIVNVDALVDYVIYIGDNPATTAPTM
jgi:hypothetical protein